MQHKEIRWKTSFLLFSIYICLIVTLTSCNSGNSGKNGIPDFQPDISDMNPISENLVARIYFDATLSMQGFVVPGLTRYAKICPDLESVIVSGWRDETVSFFRFGEKVESIDRSIYLQAGYKSFYEQTHIFRKTYIEEVILHEEQLVNAQMEASSTPEDATEEITPEEPAEANKTENQLVVIVTDLFQDDSDITLLIDLLKEKYIQKGYEVGLFGLRSQFDGTVYDIGIGAGSSLRYRSNDDPKTFRPFYLLVLGRHADIAHYFNSLKENNPDAQTVIFSRYLVSPLLSFGSTSINGNASIKVSNLNKVNYVPEDPCLLQYEIVKNSLPAKISAKGMKYAPLQHAMFFDADTFEVSSIIAKCKDDEETRIDLDARRCIEVTSTLSKNDNGNDELNVDFSLDAQSLSGETVYLYEVTLRPNVNTFQAPEWCSEWDMGDERNGAKTLNLVNFVRGLTETTAREHHQKIKIAQFYCYIGKR